jgi:hypothetical protein
MESVGLVLAKQTAGRPVYRLAQFLDGIIELNVDRLDEQLAQLFEAYMSDGGARLLMGNPAYARVLPGERSIRSEWVLPFDDVRTILEQSASIVLSDCFCRRERWRALPVASPRMSASTCAPPKPPTSPPRREAR